MMHISEYVSLGHPDKIADYISQYILDRYIERDPYTRYAVEVQIKDNCVTLGGEVSSQARLTSLEISQFVSEAVAQIGYTPEYAKVWGEKNTISSDKLYIVQHISQQSPQIAQGLSGWGDQGIFFGMATCNRGTDGMPYDHTIAKRLCKQLYDSRIGGLDIKTQVITSDDTIRKVIVAIPLNTTDGKARVERFVHEHLKGDFELIVNGTGSYIQHSSMADCGTTGRKLAVDFYGGNCKIGGGSPWTKDASKADLTLNLEARRIAKEYAFKHNTDTYVSLACCIGKKEVDVCITDKEGVLLEDVWEIDPQELRHKYKLDTPIYASMCRWGLFGEYQRDKAWEK